MMSRLFRDNVDVTIRAVGGERIGILCTDARAARRTFMQYVEFLSETTYDNWKAAAPAGRPHVTFDGGGAVHFISSSQHLDGVDLHELKWDEMPRT